MHFLSSVRRYSLLTRTHQNLTTFINKMSSKNQHDSLAEVTTEGGYLRKESTFREFVSTEHTVYTPEAGRYHLYVSLACPWANGALCALRMKGLQDMIGYSVVHPTWQRTRPDDPSDTHCGWVFRSPSDGPVTPVSGYGSIDCTGTLPDLVNNAGSVRDLYDLSKDTSGKFTVPILWDKKTSTIVNNESMDILRTFNTAFNSLLPEGSPQRDLDLFPTALEAKFLETNEWIYHTINNGVYRCGFAKSQAAYAAAFAEVFASLDRAEEILSTQRYILSDAQMTAMDIRLFMTLIRFDEVYVVYFKTNKRFLSSYPNIHNYMRELYQIPIMKGVIDMDHIKHHYFCSHPTLNTYSIVPEGQNVVTDLVLPHDRANKKGKV
jgi:putative glutathione S-transferase